METQLRIVRAQIGGMLTILVILTLLDRLTLSRYYLLSYILLLIVSAYYVPWSLSLRWVKRMRVILALATVGFVGIVIYRVIGLTGYISI